LAEQRNATTSLNSQDYRVAMEAVRAPTVLAFEKFPPHQSGYHSMNGT